MPKQTLTQKSADAKYRLPARAAPPKRELAFLRKVAKKGVSLEEAAKNQEVLKAHHVLNGYDKVPYLLEWKSGNWTLMNPDAVMHIDFLLTGLSNRKRSGQFAESERSMVRHARLLFPLLPPEVAAPIRRYVSYLEERLRLEQDLWRAKDTFSRVSDLAVRVERDYREDLRRAAKEKAETKKARTKG